MGRSVFWFCVGSNAQGGQCGRLAEHRYRDGKEGVERYCTLCMLKIREQQAQELRELFTAAAKKAAP